MSDRVSKGFPPETGFSNTLVVTDDSAIVMVIGRAVAFFTIVESIHMRPTLPVNVNEGRRITSPVSSGAEEVV